MKFNWGHALYLSLRAAVAGALLGLFAALFVALGGGPGASLIAYPSFGFWLFGIARLGWEAVNKDYPDA